MHDAQSKDIWIKHIEHQGRYMSVARAGTVRSIADRCDLVAQLELSRNTVQARLNRWEARGLLL
jgi:hypothetical protein